MNKRVLSLAFVVMSVAAAFGITYHRSFRNGYPTSAQGVVGGTRRTVGVSTNVVKLSGGFAKFRHRAWVTGAGTVTCVLEDDLEPPCHQRFILADESGRTVLVTHNIDGWERLADVAVGDVIAFKGEFVSNPKGGVIHWTHPDNSHRKPGGWLKKLKSAEHGYPCKKSEGRPCGKCGG